MRVPTKETEKEWLGGQKDTWSMCSQGTKWFKKKEIVGRVKCYSEI